MERVRLVGGQWLMVHDADLCEGGPCCIHNPTDHHMVDWPQFWRDDKGLMERICEHGIGHPDPDDRLIRGPEPSKWAGVHGCDGCCSTSQED